MFQNITVFQNTLGAYADLGLDRNQGKGLSLEFFQRSWWKVSLVLHGVEERKTELVRFVFNWLILQYFCFGRILSIKFNLRRIPDGSRRRYGNERSGVYGAGRRAFRRESRLCFSFHAPGQQPPTHVLPLLSVSAVLLWRSTGTLLREKPFSSSQHLVQRQQTTSHVTALRHFLVLCH